MRAVSQLGDAARGEAAADRLVTLGTWYQGEAYYWRAWNRRALGRLDQAASDIETAKRVLFNAAVPKLAGFIAFDREQLELALDGAVDLARAQRQRLRGALRDWASARTTRALGRRRRVVHGNHRVHASRPGRCAHADGRDRGGRRWTRRVAPVSRPVPSATAPQSTPARGLPTFNAATAHVLAGRRRPARGPWPSGPWPGTVGGACERAARRAPGTPELKFRPSRTWARSSVRASPPSGIRSGPCNWSDRFRRPLRPSRLRPRLRRGKQPLLRVKRPPETTGSGG